MDMTAQAFFDGHPDPMWIFEKATLRVLDGNDAAVRKMGYSREELCRMTIADFRHPADRPGLIDAIKALTDAPVEAGVWSVVTATGDTLMMDIHWRPMSRNGVEVVLATLRDVTNLTQTILHLREHKANLRTAKRLLGVGFWRLELESGRLDWSENVHDLYHVTERAFGRSFDDYVALVHPDDRQKMLDGWEEFSSSGADNLYFRHRVVGSDGEVILVQGVGERSIGPNGPILSGVVQDITKQSRMDDELALTSSLVRLAGRVAPIGGWRVSGEGPTVTWTEMTALIHGRAPGDVPSLQEGIAHYAPEFRARIAGAVEAGLRDGTPVDELVQLVRTDGERIWVRVIGEAERNTAGQVVALQGAIQDVSEVMAVRAQAEVSARRLAETMEQLGDALLLLDHDWRYVYVNTEAERLLGRSRDELLGQIIWEVFPDTIGTIYHERYMEAVTTGKPVRFTEHYEPLQKWFRISAHPASDGLAVYFTDVTTDRIRDDQLRLLDLAVGRVNDMVVITEPHPQKGAESPRIVYVNDAFVKRTGYSRDEIIGKSPQILQGPDTDLAESARLAAARSRREHVRAELLNYTKDGTSYWVEIDLVPLVNEEGIFTHWVAVERDNTERREAEERLRLSEERFRLVTQATEDVVWDYDIQSQQIWWGDGASRLFETGFQGEQTSPELWIDHIHPEDRERTVASIRDVIYGTDEHWRAEYRFLHKDGKVIHIVDRGSVIRDSGGKALRMIGSMSDVSSRVAMEDRIRQSQKMEAVGQLTGGVAHDFNNLLTVILGSADDLGQEAGDRPELVSLVRIIQSAAIRGAELTNRLLAFARRQTLAPKLVDANQLILGIEGLLRRTLSGDIEFRIGTQPDLWMAEIDPGQLEVALLNLAINARDAMPGGGRLTIETMNDVLKEDAPLQDDEVLPRGSYVVLSIADTGSGMSREVLARAFDPFFTTKDVGKGSGLGLSMVYGFVRQSHGHVRIDSELGAGTVVKLYFPRAGQAEQTGETPSAPPQETAVGESHRILVVEDDPLVRDYVVAVLQGLGHQVTACDNGAAGLEALRGAAPFDLLFTDVVMPGGIGGQELAAAAVALRPEIKVLLTSGYSEQGLPAQPMRGEEFHMIAKPYRRRELAATLNRIFEKAP